MDVKYDFDDDGGQARIVYVRPVEVADLPQDLRDQVPGVTRLYAVHDTDGERLALVRDRALAFTLARQHEMAPVSVH